MNDFDFDNSNDHCREAESIQHAVALAPCASAAFGELLEFAEVGYCGQASLVAKFLISTFRDSAYSTEELAYLDIGLGSRILCCLDFQRCGWVDLCELVPHGFDRLLALADDWNGADTPGVRRTNGDSE